MAQASAQICEAETFQPALLTPTVYSKELYLYTATISRKYLSCLDNPNTALDGDVCVSRTTISYTDPGIFLNKLGSSLGLHSKLEGSTSPSPVVSAPLTQPPIDSGQVESQTTGAS
ncbi:MAG: hypothetical protein M1839_006757 [Geoglossum umbratile]|nr:MAG: hypothetical protein M1839_006757 [Geoglossum umbratile]